MKRIAVSLLLALAFAAPAQAQTIPPEQVPQIEKIIRDYLLKNPEVLIEAMQALEQRQRLAAEDVARSAIAINRTALVEDPNSFVGGNPQGDVTIVEFFDYRCPYCKQAARIVHDVVAKDGNVRLVYKELPILGPDSLLASRAAIAAIQQRDRYVRFHNVLMESRGPLPETVIFETAASVGLDVARLRRDMEDPAIDRIIAANRKLAEDIGISGTPAFIIGNELVPGAVPAEKLHRAIAEARKK